jgi:hypothetical protein
MSWRDVVGGTVPRVTDGLPAARMPATGNAQRRDAAGAGHRDGDRAPDPGGRIPTPQARR